MAISDAPSCLSKIRLTLRSAGEIYTSVNGYERGELKCEAVPFLNTKL